MIKPFKLENISNLKWSNFGGAYIQTVSMTGEYSLNNLICLGMYGAYTYSFFKFDNPQSGYKDVWKGWDIGIRSTAHIGSLFIKNKKADLYIGAFSGFTTRSLVYDKSNIYRDSLNYTVDAFALGGILGFRYFFNNRFGLFSEAGFSRKFFIGGGISFNIRSKNK